MKNILFAASECVPFVKTGGLADVVGALPKSLDKDKYDVRVVIPDYTSIPQKYRSRFSYLDSFYMDLGELGNFYVGIMTCEFDGIRYYYIDNEHFFQGERLYSDILWDIQKFSFFSKAVLSMLPVIGFRPDIIHCHDWQTALIPVFLHEMFQNNPFFRGIRTIMTVHNLKFQGVWDIQTMRRFTGLPGHVFTLGRMEFHRDANMLKGGLVYADRITTVSNTYANEIRMPYYGEGLDGLLTSRVQLVIIGTGDPRYENLFRYYEWTRKGQVSANILFNETRAHRVYAAADAMLMPSRFEPCGLTQLISLRYGTVPIVRETGGLRDTVQPYNRFEQTGTGFSFANYNADEMLNTIFYAEQVFYDEPDAWKAMVERGMTKDYSWTASAKIYEELYDSLL